jgi:hypothetical protein
LRKITIPGSIDSAVPPSCFLMVKVQTKPHHGHVAEHQHFFDILGVAVMPRLIIQRPGKHVADCCVVALGRASHIGARILGEQIADLVGPAALKSSVHCARAALISAAASSSAAAGTQGIARSKSSARAAQKRDQDLPACGIIPPKASYPCRHRH